MRPDPPACEVCGETAVTVRQSRLPLPASCAYCARCDQTGLEPVQLVEAFMAHRHDGQRLDEWLELTATERKQCDVIVGRSLAFHAVPPSDRS